MSIEFARVADPRCRLGESPVYDERTDRLYFVDLTSFLLYCLDVGSGGLRSWTFESEVCSLGLAATGGLVVALRKEVILFDPATEARREICRIESDRPETRLNDGRVGPDGAFWVGSMDDRKDKEPVGALYRVSPSGAVEMKVDGLVISNGLAWTADGEIMFHADSRGPWIDRWRFDCNSGAMSERKRFAVPDEATGRPDGGSCDVEGCYWSAGVSAGRINRFALDGALVASFEVPVPAPTMPCFGGADFRTLFVTNMTDGRDPEHLAKAPLAGSLIAGRAPVAGFPSWRFLDI